MIELFHFLFFLLSFLLVFGLLNKSKIFNKISNAVIAFIIAFYVTFASFSFAKDIQKLLAYFGILVIAILGIILIYTSFKPKKQK